MEFRKSSQRSLCTSVPKYRVTYPGRFRLPVSCLRSGPNWKTSDEAVQIGLPFMLFCLSFTLNESTSWLLKDGQVEEALAVQRKLRKSGREDLVQAEIAAMLAAINEERSLKANARFLDIFNKDNRARTLAASLLAPFTSASGLG